MDYTTCYCRNPRCVLYGWIAPWAQLKFRGWHRNAARFQCQVCSALVSARTGTAYAGMHTEGSTYLQGAMALAEGLSIRATGRLLSASNSRGLCSERSVLHLQTRVPATEGGG
jgi:hypothetical protein